MRIIRATVDSANSKNNFNRVKISSPGAFTSLEVDSVNGVYLRPKDEVYVAVNDDFREPIVLGRCSGQLEIPDLVNIINGLIQVVNSNSSTFNSHVHVFEGEAGGGVCSGTTNPSVSRMDTSDKIKADDLLY